MERITSFSVDHTKLTKGVYVSRIDGELTTFDIRMTTPNLEPALDPRGAHTIEHIGATSVSYTHLTLPTILRV